MTKRTPATPGSGPAATPPGEPEAELRRRLAAVVAQPPSDAELELADRLAAAVTQRLGGHAAEGDGPGDEASAAPPEASPSPTADRG